MSEKKAVVDDRRPERAQIAVVDGKFTVTFERPPLLLFVSTDGNGRYDQLFVNGQESITHRSVTIDSAVDDLTVYHVGKYACVTEEGGN